MLVYSEYGEGQSRIAGHNPGNNSTFSACLGVEIHAESESAVKNELSPKLSPDLRPNVVRVNTWWSTDRVVAVKVIWSCRGKTC